MDDPGAGDAEGSGGGPAPDGDGQGPGWSEVLASRSQSVVHEASLVLASVGLPFEVESGGRGTRLLVPTDLVGRAASELQDYRAENVGWPPIVRAPVRRSDGVVGAAWYVFVLILVQTLAEYGSLGLDWSGKGSMHAERVRGGEVERVLTALTLHVDATHLVSNALFGVGFGVLCAHVLGGGLAWSATVLAGALGNLANAYLQVASHRSIGASTAVFGMLGLLAAFEWTRRSHEHQARFRRYAPLFGAATLLGWLGVGDGEGLHRVDVMAHVLGLLSGAAIGIVLAVTRAPTRIGSRGQVVLGVIAAASLLGAWGVALTR